MKQTLVHSNTRLHLPVKWVILHIYTKRGGFLQQGSGKVLSNFKKHLLLKATTTESNRQTGITGNWTSRGTWAVRSGVQLKHFVQGKEGAFVKLPTEQYKYKPTYLLSLAIRNNDSITNKYLICNISTYKSFLLLILLLLPYLLLQLCFFLLTWFQ